MFWPPEFLSRGWNHSTERGEWIWHLERGMVRHREGCLMLWVWFLMLLAIVTFLQSWFSSDFIAHPSTETSSSGISFTNKLSRLISKASCPSPRCCHSCVIFFSCFSIALPRSWNPIPWLPMPWVIKSELHRQTHLGLLPDLLLTSNEMLASNHLGASRI